MTDAIVEPTVPTAREMAMAAFDKWSARLGLRWWHIDIEWCDDPADVLRIFRSDREGAVVDMQVTADWRYCEARIEVNLLSIANYDAKKIERIMVHELCHILISEMHEGEMHHEERVVTGLTSAFFWVEAATIDDMEGKP